MSDFLNTGAFYLLAAVTLAGALGVVLAKKLVHAALLLTVTFIGIACLYFQLGADFLGAAQLMIYAGGVAVLIVLGVMLTRHTPGEETSPDNARWFAAPVAAALFFAVVFSAVYVTPFAEVMEAPAGNSIEKLADLMLGEYVMMFELAAALLLAALVGAIVLAKEEGQ